MSDTTRDRLIRVDMSNQTVTTEPYPEAWKMLGWHKAHKGLPDV